MVLEQFIIDADIIWDQVGKTFFENPEAKPGRIMRVQVVNAGVVEDLTGYTLNLGWTSVRDPSKFGLDAFDAVDITKGIFEIDYTSEMLTNIGPLNAALQLVPPGEGRPVESNNFKLTVKNSAINAEAIQGENSFSALETALVEVNGWNARIDEVEQDFKDRADALDGAYPVRLTAAEQSVAAIEVQVDQLNRGLGETMPTMASLLAAYPTGDTRDHIVAGNIAEVDTLTVTAIPTAAGNITVTLNGVAKTIAVDPTVQTTTTLLATLIRGTAFAGWTTGGNGSVVTFTSTTTGARTAPTFSGGTTGTTASVVVTVKGENANFHRYFWNDTAWTDGGAYQAIESNAEIKDGRIGADGTIYANIGNAIRTQSANILSAIDELSDVIQSKNLLNPDTIILGYYISNSNGQLMLYDTNYDCVDFIKIEAGKLYGFINMNSTHYALYNPDKTYYGLTTLTTVNTWVTFIAPITGYFRGSIPKPRTNEPMFMEFASTAETALYPANVYVDYYHYLYPTGSKELESKVVENTDTLATIETLFETVQSKNLVDPTKVRTGKIIWNTNGIMLDHASYVAVEQYIPIVAGRIYGFIGFGTHHALYNASKIYYGVGTITSSGKWVIFTSPITGYIRFSMSALDYQTFVPQMVEVEDVSDFAYLSYQPAMVYYNYEQALGIRDLQVTIDAKNDSFDDELYIRNLLNPDTITIGQYSGGANVSYDMGGFTNITIGQSYKVYNRSLTVMSMRTVWYYDKDGNQIHYVDNTASIPFVEGASIVRFAINTGLMQNCMMIPTDITPTEFVEYDTPILRRERLGTYVEGVAKGAIAYSLCGGNALKVSTVSMASGTQLTLNNFPQNLKKGVAMTFYAKITSFTSLQIGKGYQAYRGDYLKIDSTNISWIQYDSSEVTKGTTPHGLTFSDFISISFTVDNDSVCSYTVGTLTGTFTGTFQWGYEMNGVPFVRAAQSMTDVELGAIANDIRRPLWLFGDSYFGVAENRVIGQLKNLGYADYCLVCGLAGMGSSGAYTNLLNLMALGGMPKIIVWCEGMNDGDSSYKTYLDLITSICEANEIELILMKIPSVPGRAKEIINGYIDASGLRFVDAYKSVGASIGGTWYPGYLNATDFVHPNTIGAQAIAHRMVIDVPELMQYGSTSGSIGGLITGDL